MNIVLQYRPWLTVVALPLLVCALLAGQEQNPPSPNPPAEPAKAEAPPESSAQKPSKKEKKERKKRLPKTLDPNAPKKIVVKEGGASETPTQVTPKIEPGKANYERQSTTGLIAAAEANLERLKDYRLSRDQKATVEQIRLFVKQAREANSAADFERAHTLALKARVLSDDLLPH
jgi:hypothetical protein